MTAMSSWFSAHLVLQGASTWCAVVCVRSHNTDLMSPGISYVPVFLMTNFSIKGMGYYRSNHMIMM